MPHTSFRFKPFRVLSSREFPRSTLSLHPEPVEERDRRGIGRLPLEAGVLVSLTLSPDVSTLPQILMGAGGEGE